MQGAFVAAWGYWWRFWAWLNELSGVRRRVLVMDPREGWWPFRHGALLQDRIRNHEETFLVETLGVVVLFCCEAPSDTSS